ncbi:MAG: hypothetical protein KY457_00115 [Actinobacteria bacterium]|nr:hypothetical protein [Actinomycetota bacterium]
MVPCAHLRAFEPLDAFPPADRERWSSYVTSGGISTSEAARTEQATRASRLLTGRLARGDDAALVRRVGDRIHVCPLQLDLRAAAALREFRRTMPDLVVDAFLPDAGSRQALDRLALSGRAPHILDAPWAVPLPWFLAFEPDDRRVLDPPEGRGPRVVHLTTADQAADRLARAIEVVEATIEDGEDVLAALAEVAAWVDSFDTRSLIELDYGAVSALFAPGELQADRTCADLWDAVEGLASGDVLAAAAAYGVARSRWSSLRSKQHAS